MRHSLVGTRIKRPVHPPGGPSHVDVPYGHIERFRNHLHRVFHVTLFTRQTILNGNPLPLTLRIRDNFALAHTIYHSSTRCALFRMPHNMQ